MRDVTLVSGLSKEDRLILPLTAKSYRMPYLCYLVSDRIKRKRDSTDPSSLAPFSLHSPLTISQE